MALVNFNIFIYPKFLIEKTENRSAPSLRSCLYGFLSSFTQSGLYLTLNISIFRFIENVFRLLDIQAPNKWFAVQQVMINCNLNVKMQFLYDSSHLLNIFLVLLFISALHLHFLFTEKIVRKLISIYLSKDWTR